MLLYDVPDLTCIHTSIEFNLTNIHYYISGDFLKGHAAPVLYAAWAEAGLFPVGDLQKLRKIDSDLEGHPTPVRFLSTFRF